MVMFALSALAKDLAGLTITLSSPANSNSSLNCCLSKTLCG
jgi:hypothetical protein